MTTSGSNKTTKTLRNYWTDWRNFCFFCAYLLHNWTLQMVSRSLFIAASHLLFNILFRLMQQSNRTCEWLVLRFYLHHNYTSDANSLNYPVRLWMFGWSSTRGLNSWPHAAWHKYKYSGIFFCSIHTSPYRQVTPKVVCTIFAHSRTHTQAHTTPF